MGSTFVWDSSFAIPLQALSEQTRLVCTIWHVDIVHDPPAGTVTSKARLSRSPIPAPAPARGGRSARLVRSGIARNHQLRVRQPLSLPVG